MSLKTGYAALGAFVPAVAIGLTFCAVGAGWNGLGIVAAAGGALGLLSYIAAAASATTSFGEFMRGWLIGLNAALNAVLGFAIVSLLAGMSGGLIAGVTLGLL